MHILRTVLFPLLLCWLILVKYHKTAFSKVSHEFKTLAHGFEESKRITSMKRFDIDCLLYKGEENTIEK